MAVKQNNTEATGGAATSTVGDINNGAGVVAAGANVVNAANNKISNMSGPSNNAQQTIVGAHDVSGNIAPTVISTTKITKIPDKSSSTLGNDDNKSKPNEHQASSDLSKILQLIALVEDKRKQMSHNDMLRIYQHLIKELSRVELTRQSPEDMIRFKEDIVKVGAFFGNTTDQRHYLFYLRIVCTLITQIDADEQPPSFAIAIIFQLFNTEMVIEAVQSLLETDYHDQSIKQTVHLLCDWLRRCNFCDNLNIWIYAILNCLQRRQKFALMDEIALDNIDMLFLWLILPILRPKVATLVLHMLTTTQQAQVFHKILPRLPLVLPALQQQSLSNQDKAEDIKQLLKQLVDTIMQLMLRFQGYDDLYEPVVI